MSKTAIDLDQAAWPVLVVDAAGAVRRANAAAQRLFAGKSGAIPPDLTALWAPENALQPAQFLAQVKKAPTAMLPVKLRPGQGRAMAFTAGIGEWSEGREKLWVLQLFPGNGVAEGRPQSIEINLSQKQKLDCALQLTRTVALDFNNTLTTIMGHTSHLLGQVAADHPWRMNLVEVEKAAGRGAEIASHLAAFSSEEKDPRARVASNLNQLVRRTVELFQTPAHAQVKWVLQLETKLYATRFDEAKIQQAIVKVLENAMEAMPPDGRVVIQTRNLELAEATQDRTAQLNPGAYVCLEIGDDGAGIEPAALPRVFEPFFTTKYGHRGLGLAWVYGIVTNHGGGVALSSRPGQGTTVRIYLPSLKKIIEEKAVSEDGPGGHQTIMVVDDEEMILTMAQMVLSGQGYRMLTATSGEKALETLGQTQSLIDLLITDMVMPGMNGRELIERVRALSPQTRVLCASGCVPSPATSFGDLHMLPKPFTSQQLLRKVREVLSR
jgi:two-component system, cell cycle sensor histidine kinase and response regulator CckA